MCYLIIKSILLRSILCNTKDARKWITAYFSIQQSLVYRSSHNAINKYNICTF